MSLSYRVPILMYHRIDRLNRRSTVKGHYVSPTLFRRQMALLSVLGYSVIPLRKLATPGERLPRKPIAITFDDGYVNFATNALPVLKSRGFAATVFLVANQIGGANRWDSDAGDVEEALMSRAEILECRKAGIDFGSHTLDHADLPAASKEEAWRQIAGSKSNLEEDLGLDIDSFCYPYGRMDYDVRNMVERAGYKLACSTEKGINTEATDRFALRRINVRRDTSIPVFAMKLVRGSKHGP